MYFCVYLKHPVNALRRGDVRSRFSKFSRLVPFLGKRQCNFQRFPLSFCLSPSGYASFFYTPDSFRFYQKSSVPLRDRKTAGTVRFQQFQYFGPSDWIRTTAVCNFPKEKFPIFAISRHIFPYSGQNSLRQKFKMCTRVCTVYRLTVYLKLTYCPSRPCYCQHEW